MYFRRVVPRSKCSTWTKRSQSTSSQLNLPTTSATQPRGSQGLDRSEAPIQFGSVRKRWRGAMRLLDSIPALQQAAVKAATYFTPAHEIDFGLPRVFDAHFTILDKVGEGSFGQVYLVSPKKMHTQLELAVKVVPKSKIVTSELYSQLQQECQMMTMLGGTLNVVHFFGAYEDDTNVYIVMEYCNGGDAAQRLTDSPNRQDTRYHEALVALYMSDIFHVVWQCHLLHIVHSDLKLENFLFADKRQESPIKLTDFGGASFLLHPDKEMLHDVRGTPLYTAPEVLQQQYSFPSDMWSCGVILYRLLTGRFPISDGELLDERILVADIDFEADPWPYISKEAAELTQNLLQKDPSKRLTAADALQHPWLLHRAVEAPVVPRPRDLELPTEHPVEPVVDGTMLQKLQLHRSRTRLQNHLLTQMADRLPMDIIRHYVVLFSDLSRQNNVQVNVDILAKYLLQQGYRVSMNEACGLLLSLDVNNDGQISLPEFVAGLLDWQKLRRQAPEVWQSTLESVFQELDDDKDGYVALSDLTSMLKLNSQSWSLLQWANVRKEDGGGWITISDMDEMLRMHGRSYDYYATRLARPIVIT